MRYHVAIMKKSLGMIPKILSGEKTIESRWYLNRRCPWGQISSGDVIFFKNSGEPVTIRSKVHKVIMFERLTTENTNMMFKKYGKKICLDEAPKNKRYCILMFLKKAKRVRPFDVDKTGFGTMAAWLTYTSPSFLPDQRHQDSPGEF